MGYFKLPGSDTGGAPDLSGLETEIISRGGTVNKAGTQATVAELIAGIASIPAGTEPIDLTPLADAIRARGGTVTDVTLQGLINAVGTIPVSTGGGSTPEDLTPIETAITTKGGTVNKASSRATVQELAFAVGTIPQSGVPGVPIGPVISETVTFANFLTVTEEHSFTFKEQEAGV